MIRKFVLASTSVMALGAYAAGASAQDEEGAEESDDVIVVQGYRQAVQEALDIKRNSVQVVDSIVAEDIGKFPDQNVVEALQRVTGVQVTDRAGGETSGLTIRGLPDVTTTWNGRNVFTAAGGSLALQDIPSSLVSRIDVYKSRSPEQFEAGLAGQIDIITRRPLDFDGFKASAAVNARYNEQRDAVDPNVNGLISYSTDTDMGKVGALLAVSYNQIRYRDQSITSGAAVPYVTEDNLPPGFAPLQLIGRDIYTPGLREGLPTTPGSTLTFGDGNDYPYYLARDAVFQSDLHGKRERPAASIALQWAPDDNSTYTFEYLYQGYRQETFNSLQFQFVDWWGSLPSPVEDTFNLYDGTNVISDREVFNAFGFTSGDQATGNTDTHAYALNAEWSLLDGKLDLVADASYQNSEFNGDFFAGRIERVAPEVYVDFNEDDGIPSWNYGDTQNLLTDPSVWTVAQLYDSATRDKGDATTFTLDGDYALDWDGPIRLNTFSFGARWDDRGATAGLFENPAGVFLGQPLTNFPELYYINDGFFDGQSNTPDSWINVDGRTLRDNRDKYRQIWRDASGQPIVLSDEAEILDNFDVNQETTSIYAMVNGETEIAGRRLFGQAGVRYVEVSTDSTFLQRDTMELQSISVEEEKFLPSFTLNYDLTDDVKLRLNYGETLRRPGFGDLNPFINYNADINNDRLGSATGGNPALESTSSKNLDFAVEYYFGESNALYATFFHKQIEGLVVSLPTILPKPADLTDPVYADTDDFSFSRPTNGSDGDLTGIELGFVYWPDMLPDPFDGFGVLGSVTFLDSEQRNVPLRELEDGTVLTATQDFFSVSDLSYNVTGAYERGPFSARLSYVWREDFLSRNEAPDFANPLGIYRQSDPSLDFSASYDLNERLAISFDAVNLTDTIQKEYYQYEDTGGLDIFNFGNVLIGRTFQLGLRYDY